MSRPRALLLLLGIAFFIAAVVASAYERLFALGFLIVGAFLVVLPFLAVHEED